MAIGFVAPIARRKKVKSKLRKLAKRAHTTFERIDGVTEVLAHSYQETTQHDPHGCETWVDGALKFFRRVTHRIECDRYELGDIPEFEGHEFLARVEHTEAGNIVSCAPGKEGEWTKDARIAEPVCEHCGLKRLRRDTFLLQVDGTIRQIGRNCLAEYFAVDPDRIIAAAELLSWLQELQVADWSDEGYGAGGSAVVHTLDYVACVVASHEEHGFHATSSLTPTRVDASWRYSPPSLGADRDLVEAWKRAQPTAEQRGRAWRVLAWAQDLPGDGDYEHNLKIAAMLPDVRRNAGILASIVQAYDRAMGIEAERKAKAAQPDGGPVGELKQRLELQATLLVVKSIESDWGSSTLYKFRTEQGSDLVWFSSGSCPLTGEDIGKQVTLRGTVKRHEEYAGRSQTLLSRCKVLDTHDTQ